MAGDNVTRRARLVKTKTGNLNCSRRSALLSDVDVVLRDYRDNDLSENFLQIASNRNNCSGWVDYDVKERESHARSRAREMPRKSTVLLNEKL